MTLNSCSITPNQPLDASPIPQKALTLSRKLDECKPLYLGSIPVPPVHKQRITQVTPAPFKFPRGVYNADVRVPMVGRCRLTVSKPVLTAAMVSALETIT
jgi:hypothetical protein